MKRRGSDTRPFWCPSTIGALLLFWIFLGSGTPHLDAGEKASPETSRPASGPRYATTSGNNGDSLDPYIASVAASPGGDQAVAIPMPALLARCADDDGCSVRLSYLGSTSSDRATDPPFGFAVVTDGTKWESYDMASAAAFGINGANGEQSVQTINGAQGSCVFADDLGTPPDTFFQLDARPGLFATEAMQCTLRLDD